MKKNKRLAKRTRSIAIFAAAILMVGTLVALLPSNRNWLKADAAANYNASAALEYAANHWNDGKGLCAEFVSDCLNAGGVSAWSVNTTSLMKQLRENNEGTVYQLTTTGNKIKMSDNVGKVTAGDPIFWYCSNCDRYKHTALCNGASSAGNLVNYAHNGAQNGASEVYIGSCYDCGNAYAAMYSVHMNECSLTAPTVTTAYKYYAENAQVTVNWNAISGATDYWFVIWRDGQQIFSQSVGNTTSYTFNVTNGYYEIYVGARNESTSILSECYQFYAGYLEKPVVTTSSKYYAENASVTINWNECAGATGYWIHIWENDVNIVNKSVGNVTSYNLTCTKGNYTVSVEAYSEAGGWQTIISDDYLFYAGYLDKPVVTTSSKYYVENAPVTISWNECKEQQVIGYIYGRMV